MRFCGQCANEMPARARVDARFCSGRCRVAAHRAARGCAVPEEMRQLERWVSWWPDKSPRQVGGRPASSTDAGTWTSWSRASATGRQGFVLNGDGIVCVDLDHCLEGGRLAPWAAGIVAACAGTYVEVSPSGTGLHIFGRGRVGRGRRIRDGRNVEVYGSGRYIAVTGRRWAGSPSVLGDISHALPA